MKLGNPVRRLLLSAMLAAAAAAAPAFAQISVNISIAPPPAQYEIIPIVAPGQLWVPGYWAWNHDRHIWIRGRTIVQREGYRWEPDRWVRRSDDKYYRLQGRWERDDKYKIVKMKKEKKNKYWKNDDDDRSGHGNRGRNGKNGKGRDKHD